MTRLSFDDFLKIKGSFTFSPKALANLVVQVLELLLLFILVLTVLIVVVH